ncbi:hypothetical protein EJ06DRAFT_469581 [Trichodelitschia bisporula]|uniref:RGS domain-containing protein n=1 Tax=Trichodelitschia bisporula TaxID=703511 RepID=A0A6G1I8C6_9PEZI|nr:hypothetical protein EJ06DRAFT_469581 [Trichodelitschia bisporula]
MAYSLSYRRPARVLSPKASLSDASRPTTGFRSILPRGIPEALSFDRIIAGGTCPPMTARDFMHFAKYVEHSAENLQFFLWFKDFAGRFEALTENERKLAPEWTREQTEVAHRTAYKNGSLATEAAAILKAQRLDVASDPFCDAQATDTSVRDLARLASPTSAVDSVTSRQAEGAFEDAGCVQPFTIQPYREEISRIIALYVAEGAPRQLNLSSRERSSLLRALEVTTHPSAFRVVVETVEWSLRSQTHPNFVRWAICNGNRPRVTFARGLGVTCISAGLLTGVLITLSAASRQWRVMAFLPFMVGISTLVAAWKGMCVVLHGLHRRHLRPWELFSGDDFKYDDDWATQENLCSNSYEDEPWVAKYDQRNIVRKIFDREVWIEEPALRQIQDTIFLQALLLASAISILGTGIFCALPQGNFY